MIASRSWQRYLSLETRSGRRAFQETSGYSPAAHFAPSYRADDRATETGRRTFSSARRERRGLRDLLHGRRRDHPILERRRAADQGLRGSRGDRHALLEVLSARRFLVAGPARDRA